MKIIFVCTGNTCRSPMAEKIFADKVSKLKDQKDVEVESRGVACSPNMPMSLNSRVIMTKYGLDTKHLSRPLTSEDLDNADYIIAMTDSHKNYIEQHYGKTDNVYSMNDITGLGDVIDPYGGTVEDYERCYQLLVKNIDIIINKLFG